VDTSAGFRDAYVRIEQAVVHSHGTGGIHSHEGIASTTWLDFEQASKQAQAVAEALIRKRPEWKTLVAENLEALGADLAELDKKARDIVHAKPDQPLLASHPVYQYLEQRYGLHLQSMHWEPTVMPVATEWTGLTKIRMKHPARWMLWEAVPTPEIAKRLKAMGIGSLEFSPCAQRPASGDFLSEMQRNLENLRTAFH
jgi:zinc transport system substrate-binding protein